MSVFWLSDISEAKTDGYYQMHPSRTSHPSKKRIQEKFIFRQRSIAASIRTFAYNSNISSNQHSYHHNNLMTVNSGLSFLLKSSTMISQLGWMNNGTSGGAVHFPTTSSNYHLQSSSAGLRQNQY